MTIPRPPSVNTKPTNDPKLAGMKGMTSLFIEKIPAVSAMGKMDNCGVRKVVRNSSVTLFGNYELTIVTNDSPLMFSAISC